MPGSLFLIKLQAEAGNFIKKETLAQVFSCEFCEISKSAFSYRTPPVAASLVQTNIVDLYRQHIFYVNSCIIYGESNIHCSLTHSFPMHSFSTPLKTSENRKVF